MDAGRIAQAQQFIREIADRLRGRRADARAHEGPWDRLIRQEIGPNRSAPIHGVRPFNPAQRRKGG